MACPEPSRRATFAELLSEYMARTGIGDADLARRVGVSRLTLVRWKEGITSRPRYQEDVLRCGELLRLTPEELDEFLLAAGFSPERAVMPDSGQEADLPVAPPDGPFDEPSGEPSTETPTPIRRRVFRMAGAALIVLAIALGAGLAAVKFLGGPAYPVAAQGESLIVMAPFINYTAGQQGFNVRGRLRKEIDREIREAGLAGVRTAEWPEAVYGNEAAVAAGRRTGATMVIWGEYDSGRVMATFTIPGAKSQPHDQQIVDLASSPAELPTTININFTDEVRSVAMMTLGQLYLEQGHFDRAKMVLIQALARPPSEPEALASLRFRLGRAYLGGQLADLDEAIWLFSQVLAVQPRSADTYTSRGLAYLERGRVGDVDLAIADFTQAIAIAPSRGAAYLNRAVALLERGGERDLRQAISDLDQAIAIDPEYASAYVNRASVYLARRKAGDLDLAFADLRQAISIAPTLATAYLNRGNAYLQRGQDDDFALAKDDYTRAIELAPDSPMHYFNRGLVHSELEDWDRSIADFQRAQELRPGDFTFNNALCWQLGAQGEPNLALPYCDLALAPDLGEMARDGRGLVLALLGRNDEAIGEFEAFLSWVDTSPKESCRGSYHPSRRAWVEELQAGGNPFDADTLRRLRVRPVVSAGDPC